MRVRYDVLEKYTDSDPLRLEFEKVTSDLSKIDMEHGVNVILNYYRKYGFLDYKIRQDEKYQQIRNIIKFDVNNILLDKKIEQTMHGLRLCWTYHPHFWEVKCGNAKFSPMDVFKDDDRFKSTIRKCWKWCEKHQKGDDGIKLTENRLRQSLKIYSGTQSVSNFRPTAAKLIYEKYGGDVVWDMSSGWGGRLLGFLSASNTKQYIGTEPSSKTYDGLIQMGKDFSYLGKQVNIYKLGSEDYKPIKESFDLCFTSPPYFDTEKYSDEDTQSYKKFPTQDDWVNGFLKKTIENCYVGLKDKRYMLMNIANTPKYKFIEEQTIKISKECGFVLEDTLQLILSSISGQGQKYEPIFVFRKESR